MELRTDSNLPKPPGGVAICFAFCIFFFLGGLLSLDSAAQQPPAAEMFSYKTFQNADKSWGYDVLRNGNLFIRQTTIPAIQGKKGFTRQKQAKKLALFVVGKLRKNPDEFPSVTIKELATLKLID